MRFAIVIVLCAIVLLGGALCLWLFHCQKKKRVLSHAAMSAVVDQVQAWRKMSFTGVGMQAGCLVAGNPIMPICHVVNHENGHGKRKEAEAQGSYQ